MKKGKLLAISFLVTIFLSSCATILTGAKRKVLFETNPPGATLYVNGIERCTTPCDYRVTAEDAIKFGLDGYSERVIIMDSKFNLVSILNGISIIGWGVDALSGSLKRVDSKYIKIDLKESNEVALLDKAMSNGRITKVDINTSSKVIETIIVMPE